MSPRRLEAEILRDAMLSLSGTLNREAGGPAFRPYIPPEANLARNIKGGGCPRDAKTPVVIREGSAYSHEPTASGKSDILKDWQHIHDNGFLLEGLDESRLANQIKED